MELTVNGIYKSFGEKEVLKNITFSASSGSAHGLLGRNGAGKTTTIRIIMGVFFPDKGSVVLDGKQIDRSRVRIGYMPEERGLYPKKQIGEQLIYLSMLRGMKKAEATKSCDKWLERMGMSEYKNKKLETLSKGNQQKIQLAATLMCNPDIVILDEPFSGLDPVNAMLLKDVIKEMIAEGAVVLFSSHQMNYVEEFCDSISILNGGRSSSQCDRIAPFVIQKLSGEILSADMDKENENSLIIRLKDPAFKARLLKELSDNDFDIDEFRVCEPSLNDIFVQYTEAGI